MASRNVYKKLGYRFAEEMQLIAEEKWILEALNKIKKQRNSLQIERLQLESLKAALNSNVTTGAEIQRNVSPTKIDIEVPAISTIDLMQSSTIDLMQNNRPKTDSGIVVIEPSEYLNFESQCNTEELNLQVTTPVYNRPPKFDNSIEEDESEDDDENVFIDINMLMNGIQDENNE